jgi:hypothetical protein
MYFINQQFNRKMAMNVPQPAREIKEEAFVIE